MRLIAQSTVRLPFSLDYYALGSEVGPLTIPGKNAEIAIFFPARMSEGTCGKDIYADGGAWWTADRLTIAAALPIAPEGNNLEALRTAIIGEMNEALRRFFDLCRVRLDRPDIYPVTLDTAEVTIALEHEDGRREALPEPETAFFYQSLTSEPPKETSLNEVTLTELGRDLEAGAMPSIREQLLLDARWLRSLGEDERADTIERLAQTL